MRTITKNKWGVVAAVIAFAVFCGAVTFDLVDWDDHGYLLKNAWFDSTGLDFITGGLTGIFVGNWHPLTMFSYALDYAIWGGHDSMGYHLTNTLLHAVNTYLVFVLALRLFGLARELDCVKGYFQAAALFAALLFALHPLHVESVVWVSERKDVLSAFFSLFAILAYVDYAGDSTRGRAAYAKASVFFLLALLSKPMAVTLPVVFLILDFYPLERTRRRSWASLLLEKVPFFILSAALAVITIVAQKNVAIESLSEFSVEERVLNAAFWYFNYLYKTVLPFGLSPTYLFPADVGLDNFKYAISAVCFVAVCVSTYALRSRIRPFFAAWAYHVVTLLPVIGIVQVGPLAGADRYMYMPSLGVFLLAAGCALYFGALTKGVWMRRAFAAALSLAVVLLAAKTFYQQKMWKDSISLWSAGVAYITESNGVYKTKRDTAFLRRAKAYYRAGMFKEAAADLGVEIKFVPGRPDLYNLRGVCYVAFEDYERAIGDFKRAIELDAKYAEPYFNLTVVYSKLNDKKAAAFYKKAYDELVAAAPGA